MLFPLSKALQPLARPSLLRRTLQSHLPATNRPFSHSPPLAYPRKDSQDKDSIQAEATEYSKSGTDDDAARQEEAAFDPEKTSPEDEKDTAGDGDGGNPLEVSPANPDAFV
ncbi:hypothetical protein LPUS_02737 [Lasallia pustulata]|uniref:Uncharacterized protein n=1 Tax=Lasallia pustulata TaxID=136370 RepID=A0A1W5CT93_9LECA|nr:hypothetical protein LPUS_02737 [Lasallia pustulata]